MIESITIIVAAIGFVLAIWGWCKVSWLKERLAFEKCFSASLAKDRLKAIRECKDGHDLARQYLEIHKRDQDEIKQLRDMIKHLIDDLGTIATAHNRIVAKTSDYQIAVEDRLKKIPTNPPPSGCS